MHQLASRHIKTGPGRRIRDTKYPIMTDWLKGLKRKDEGERNDEVADAESQLPVPLTSPTAGR